MAVGTRLAGPLVVVRRDHSSTVLHIVLPRLVDGPVEVCSCSPRFGLPVGMVNQPVQAHPDVTGTWSKILNLSDIISGHTCKLL